MLIATGGRNPAAALDASLKQIEGKEGLIKAALAQSFGAQLSSTQGNRAEVSWIGLGPTFALFDSYDSLAQFDTYRHSPSLLVYRSSLPFDGRIQVGTDIVQSKRRLRNPAAANTKEALRSVIEYGVWESVTEGLLLVGELPQGTHQAFAEYRQKGMTFQVLTPELEATLAGLPLSGSQKINLSRELERGYSVVLPDTASLEQVSHLYWWRVDPSTGETLGVAGSGAGNAATERLITERIYHGLVTFVAVTIVCSAAAGTVSAAHFPGLLTYGDCVGIALGMAVGAASGPRYVAGIGMWLGFTLAVLALSKVLDFYAGPPNWWREKP
jgi:hypothetical protein